MVGIVMSVSPSNGIGKDNKLLYHNIADMKLFRENTKGKVVIMGRATWDSLPKKPLSDRINVVVTSKKPTDYLKYENTHFITIRECDNLINLCNTILRQTDVYLIGGARLINRYKNQIGFMYISHFKNEKEADTYLPELDMSDKYLTYEEDFGEFIYKEYSVLDDLTKGVIKILENGSL